MLSPQTIEELRQILREEYGRDLTLEETRIIATTTVSYFDLLARMQHSTISDQEVIGESSKNKLTRPTIRG